MKISEENFAPLEYSLLDDEMWENFLNCEKQERKINFMNRKGSMKEKRSRWNHKYRYNSSRSHSKKEGDNFSLNIVGMVFPLNTKEGDHERIYTEFEISSSDKNKAPYSKFSIEEGAVYLKEGVASFEAEESRPIQDFEEFMDMHFGEGVPILDNKDIGKMVAMSSAKKQKCFEEEVFVDRSVLEDVLDSEEASLCECLEGEDDEYEEDFQIFPYGENKSFVPQKPEYIRDTCIASELYLVGWDFHNDFDSEDMLKGLRITKDPGWIPGERSLSNFEAIKDLPVSFHKPDKKKVSNAFVQIYVFGRGGRDGQINILGGYESKIVS